MIAKNKTRIKRVRYYILFYSSVYYLIFLLVANPECWMDALIAVNYCGVIVRIECDQKRRTYGRYKWYNVVAIYHNRNKNY